MQGEIKLIQYLLMEKSNREEGFCLPKLFPRLVLLYILLLSSSLVKWSWHLIKNDRKKMPGYNSMRVECSVCYLLIERKIGKEKNNIVMPCINPSIFL